MSMESGSSFAGADVRLDPILKQQPWHPFKFIDIIYYKYQPGCPGMTGNQHIVRSYGPTDSVQSPYLSEMVNCFAVEGQHFKSSEFRRQDSECLFTDILVIGTNQVQGVFRLEDPPCTIAHAPPPNQTMWRPE